MDFKDILEQWEQSPEGQKAADKSRFSHIMREKEEGSRQAVPPGTNGVYHTGHSSLGHLKAMHPQDCLDLHGVTAEEAIRMVDEFISQSLAKQLVKIQIVHGRGLHSPDGRPVLKQVVMETLRRSPYVRSTATPPPAEGGTGSVWVILQRGKSEPMRR
ncbi:MAG: Smr/MutS family protein [Sphaerochaetaceae bacterium]